MALIDNRARVVEDLWSYPGTDGDGAARLHQVIPFHVLVAIGSEGITEGPIGAFVTSDVTTDQIGPLLGRLDLVVLEFPKFRDGRGFTVARALRERHGFTGDIRAIGHILPDQFEALVQCGFSTIVTPREHPPEQWQRGARSAASGSMSGGPLLQRLIGRRAVSSDGTNKR